MISSLSAPTLDDISAQVLWVGDTLIPADPEHGMPSASGVGVPKTLLPRALKARPDLLEPFIAALSRLPPVPPEAPLDALRDLGTAEFDLVSHLIAGAYFLDESVNRTLRYPGQEALLETPDYDEIMEVVQRVIDRGPVYIDVPEQANEAMR